MKTAQHPEKQNPHPDPLPSDGRGKAASAIVCQRLQYRRRGSRGWRFCRGEVWSAIETIRNPEKMLERARQTARHHEFRIVPCQVQPEEGA